MRDVAYVHDGSPPQTNVVQLNGRKGVLMSILKIGSASTLDIIAGVKARLPAIEATLPPGVNLTFVGDQSDFVKSSVAAVVREGLIAAALTGFMILVFLGSWRSTLIITVSIPPAVLSSLTALSLFGQTINVMTLGGLALTVGILVDDATVTIENINRHMEEHGEDILTAITRGAHEIVPLLALGGVAGYLFRPLAMAVVFAITQTAPTYWLNPANGVSYAVSVQTPQYAIDTLGELKNLPLAAAQSTQLLGGLATLSPEPLNAIVSHYDIRNIVNIYATTQDRDLGGVAADIQKIVDDARAELPKGSTVTIRGQVATMASACQQLLIGLAFSAVLIYLLIVVNFQSWLDPFVIITALPAALAGIVWMLFLTHTTLSVPALTGAIMCMGVATANSILVVSFAREKLAEGKSAVEAALEAGATRFRPVLMTALAMIIGMAPMAIESGQNSPLGRAVIGGLMFATLATLLFVPTVFSIVRRVHPSKATVAEPLAGLPSHA
jgi:multidrug efflux pump subunit AcrB